MCEFSDEMQEFEDYLMPQTNKKFMKEFKYFESKERSLLPEHLVHASAEFSRRLELLIAGEESKIKMADYDKDDYND